MTTEGQPPIGEEGPRFVEEDPGPTLRFRYAEPTGVQDITITETGAPTPGEYQTTLNRVIMTPIPGATIQVPGSIISTVERYAVRRFGSRPTNWESVEEGLFAIYFGKFRDFIQQVELQGRVGRRRRRR